MRKQPITQNELTRRMLNCGGISPDYAENEAVVELLEKVERLTVERDSAVARAEKMERVVEAARLVSSGMYDSGADLMLHEALAAFAAAPDHIGDATGKVEAAPSEREKRLEEALKGLLSIPLDLRLPAETVVEFIDLRNNARAALAAAPDHIADVSKKVEAAPSEREKRLEEALRLLSPIFEFGEPIDEDTAFLVTHHTPGLKEAFESARAALADTANTGG